MRRKVTAPGVAMPAISNGSPLGSLMLTRAVMMPSAAIAAETTLTLMPGRMKLIRFWSAAWGRTCPLELAFRAAPEDLWATRGATCAANARIHIVKNALRERTILRDSLAHTVSARAQRRRNVRGASSSNKDNQTLLF